MGLQSSSSSSNLLHDVLPHAGVQVRNRRLKRGPQVLLLDESHMEEICELEQRSYRTPWSPELIRAEFGKDISYRLGLTIDCQIAAYSFSYLIPEDMHVLNLAVAPEFRGQGFGKYLLANVLYRALLLGVRNVNLEVRVNNAIAQRLYSSLGFEQIGVRRCYYRDTGEDALVLELKLDSRNVRSFERMIRSSFTVSLR